MGVCLSIVFVCAVSYIIGSLNTAIIAGRLLNHSDIRDYGSKNAGLTNVYRSFGTKAAVLTVFLDVLKGVIVVFGTRLALFSTGLLSEENFNVTSVCMLAVMFDVMGHCFPMFYGFKGGKGILSVGICTVLFCPVVILLEAIVFFSLTAITRYVSVASIACCAFYPIFFLVVDALTIGFCPDTFIHFGLALIMGIFCAVRHYPNMQRLANHTENKFELRKRG